MENQKQITENNKLLAEFMNWEYTIVNNTILQTTLISDLDFSKDWNWLMQVVEKIESLDHWVEILGGLQKVCLIGSINSSCESFKSVGETKIEAVYNACVEFVKWYNEQKQLKL